MAKEPKVSAEGKAPADSLEAQLGKIADMMLGKMNPGIVGGTPYVSPSAEELAKLPKKTLAEVASEYFQGKDETNFPYPGIHVSEDHQIFIGNIQGDNAMANHRAANPHLTFMSFSTPGYVAPTKE